MADTRIRVKSADSPRRKKKGENDGAASIPIVTGAVVASPKPGKKVRKPRSPQIEETKIEEKPILSKTAAEIAIPEPTKATAEAAASKATKKTKKTKKSVVSESAGVESVPFNPVVPAVVIFGDEPKDEKAATPKKVRASKGSKKAVKEEVPAAKVPVISSLVATTPIKIKEPVKSPFEHRYGRTMWVVGVVHIFIGLCFATRALAGIYVDGVELSLRDYTGPGRHYSASVLLAEDGGTSYMSGTTNTLTQTTSSTSGTSGTSGSDGSSGSDGDSGDSNTTSTSGTSSTNESGSSNTITSTQTTTSTTASGTDSITATSGTSGETTHTTTSTTTAVTTNTTNTVMGLTTNLSPKASIMLSTGNPLKENVRLAVTVAGANKVEMMLQPAGGLVARYLGSAGQISDGSWRFDWDTRQVPNGQYTLYVYVQNQYGQYRGGDLSVSVQNDVTTPSSPSVTPLSPEQVTQVQKEIQAVNTEVNGDASTPSAPHTTSAPATPPPQPPAPVAADTENKSLADVSKQLAPPESPIVAVGETKDVQVRLTSLDAQLDILYDRLSVALRSNDTTAADYIRKQIDTLRESAVKTLVDRNMLSQDQKDAFDQKLKEAIGAETEKVTTRERIIKERVGEGVFADADKDGVSDYDEVNIYHTDPALADSDNDGFTDGAEIMSGYDPKSSDREAPIAFEDPKENGPVRDDLLSVASVDTVKPVPVPDEATDTTSAVEAKFSGKALPNSFVTLYIFSQPVVVTVRTAEDGSWSYTFDKELEDGSHTMYVGITDNAGRIIAKSKPFPFVKTAEAYAGGTVNTAPAASEMSEPAVVSTNVFLLIVALSVILIGLSLVALGAYFVRRGHEQETEEMVLRPV